MKKLLASLVVLCLNHSVWCEEGDRGLVVPAVYEVSNVVSDIGLEKGTTKVVFQFNYGTEWVKAVDLTLLCNGDTMQPEKDAKGYDFLVMPPGNYTFSVSRYDMTMVTGDSVELADQTTTTLTANRDTVYLYDCIDKPVIYLYPSETTQAEVKLDFKGELKFTYPAYDNGWQVTAHPDGQLECNGKQYDYLFWDGEMPTGQLDYNEAEGFIVGTDTLVGFLENALTAMGLNASETQDFITYWVPRMDDSPNNYVHFIFTEDYDQIASLSVTPQPDLVFRLFMVWSKELPEQYGFIQPQELPAFTRTGFTVVEWGGTEAPPYYWVK